MTERKAPRHPAHIRIFFSHEGLEGEGVIRDLSKHGCRVESETVPIVGQELEASLFSPDFDWPLKVENAVVRWTGHESFGLEFVELAPPQRERLRRLIAGPTQLGLKSPSASR